MSRPMSFLALLATLSLSACASRTLSAAKAGSALAASSPDAPHEVVTRSLQADAPLPGESTAGWMGLDEEPAPPEHQSHEHGSHEHGGAH